MRLHLEAIVLAAGSSVRFGSPKLLAPWRGGVLLDGALEAALAAPVRGVTVVTGAYAEGVEAVVSARGGRRLRTVFAADHAEGLSASLRAGVASLPACDGVLVFLGDMPAVPHGMAGALVAASGGAEAAAPVVDGRRGHPVLLRAGLFGAVARLRGDAGAGRLLAELGDGLVLVPTDDLGVLRDVDVPGDLEL